MSFYSEIIDLILNDKINSKEELHKTKVKFCKKYQIDNIPPDSEILAQLSSGFSEIQKKKLISILRKKSMRTISGVAIVAVMTSPWDCPHGKCIPCPGGPEVNTPQSYTGYEPAAMRAIINDFDPYLQTKSRIDQLNSIGHSTDKIDLILMGGTFTSRPIDYQTWFVKRCLDALNKKNSINLEMAKKINEIAPSRCIGLTIETRPDWFRLQHVDNSLKIGATRVELGVQTVYDDILFNINRGHTVTDSISATKIAKDSGFKVCYHIMPGLPGSDEKRDMDTFLTVFKNPDFKPDLIKIYPTLVVKGTILHDMWKSKKFVPLTNIEASKRIAKIKKIVPEWVRIQRIQRDIPAPYIDAGVDKSNLRQIIDDEMKQHGFKCRCIRCREIGHKFLRDKIEIDEEDISLETNFYESSNSEEIFCSIVDKKNDGIIGYLRLRNIISSHRYELLKNPCMIIRELKIVGREIPIGQKGEKGLQHKGHGKELIKEAERICTEKFDKKHLFVLSGVGVKKYYRSLNFKDNGIYLEKILH